MERKRTTLAVVLFASAIGSADLGRADAAQEVSVETLKELYIECERRAALQALPSGDIARCSEVYEALKLRAFGGDWTRLRDWLQKRLVAEAQA